MNQILEQTNPVYNTAKMTLFLLSMAGDSDAAAIVDKLGLTLEDTQNSASTVASPEQIIASIINMEVRYNTMCRLAEEETHRLAEATQCSTYVDIPCGYTPRAIQFSRKGLRYIGMDLPVAIEEVEPAIIPILDARQRELVEFAGVDATNYESLETALKGVQGPLFITTEGLLMYFTESEAGIMCDNMRRLLEEYGGMWITSDPENLLRRMLVLQILCGEHFIEIQESPHKRAARLAVPFPPSAACKFFDLPPVSLQNLRLHLTKNSLASRPPLLCGASKEISGL